MGCSRQPGDVKRGSGTWVDGGRHVWVDSSGWLGGQKQQGDNGHLNIWREVSGWVMGWKMTEGWMALGGMLGG